MNQTDQAKKIVIVAIANLFLLGAFVTFFWIRPKPPVNPPPVPVGTNELKVGAKLYNPTHPESFQWTVIDVDRNYEFPDGDNRLGVKVRGESGSVWIPREKLENLMMVQSFSLERGLGR
jgi:hypothetical protein